MCLSVCRCRTIPVYLSGPFFINPPPPPPPVRRINLLLLVLLVLLVLLLFSSSSSSSMCLYESGPHPRTVFLTFFCLFVWQVYLVTLITYLFVPEAHKAIDSSLVAGITIYGVCVCAFGTTCSPGREGGREGGREVEGRRESLQVCVYQPITPIPALPPPRGA
jgi:hypothetical protein